MIDLNIIKLVFVFSDIVSVYKTYIKIIFILVGGGLSSHLYGSEYPFTWINIEGQKVKRWEITNEKYMLKESYKRKFSQDKAELDSTATIDKFDNNTQRSTLKAALSYGLVELRAKDKINNSRADVYSNYSIGMDLQWNFIEGKWNHFIGSSFEKISFKHGNHEIEESKVNLLGVRLGSLYGRNLIIGGYVEHRQYPFLSVLNSNYTIEVAPLTLLGMNFGSTLKSEKKWSFGYDIYTEYVMGGKLSDVEVTSGLNVGIQLTVMQRYSDFNLLIDLDVANKSQDTSDIEQSQTEVKVATGVRLSY